MKRSTDGINTDAAATHFGHFCDRVTAFGWDVHLEFIPFTEIPDLETAWEIGRTADRDNGSLFFDKWHYFRGMPDDDLL